MAAEDKAEEMTMPNDGAMAPYDPETSAAPGDPEWTERYINALSDGAPAEAEPEESAEADEAAEASGPPEEDAMPSGEVEEAVPSSPGTPYLCNRVVCRSVCGEKSE